MPICTHVSCLHTGGVGDLAYPLVADLKKEISEAYGVLTGEARQGQEGGGGGGGGGGGPGGGGGGPGGGGGGGAGGCCGDGRAG
jgi:hypothetical protein